MRAPLDGYAYRIAGLCLLSRAVFAAVLFPWFLIGALSKVGGLSLSLGPTVGHLPLSLGAYYAYVPGVIHDAGPDLTSFGILTEAYVALLVLMELLLPTLIILGWHARAAVILLALHQAFFLFLGQTAESLGAIFDASPFDMVPDQLLLWIMSIVPLAIFGAGPISVDDGIRRWKGRRR